MSNFDSDWAPLDVVNARPVPWRRVVLSVACLIASVLLLLSVCGCRMYNVTVQWPITIGDGTATADSISEQDVSPDGELDVGVAP